MAVTTKGAKQHHAAKKLRMDWEATYGKSLADLDLNDQEFRFTAIRPDISNVRLDDYIEQVTWKDEGNQYNLNTIPVLRGTLTWRGDDPELPGGRMHLGDGHRVRCEVKWIGTWMPLWEMRVLKPPALNYEDGTTTAELGDDLILATLSKGDFKFKKSKKRPHGWRYHEIVAYVCRRYRIPVSKLTAGRAWIPHLADDLNQISPLEVIRQAVLKEQEYTGQRLNIAWRWDEHQKRFALHVISVRRNPVLYTFSDDIRNVTIEPIRRSMFATTVVAHGSGRKVHGKRVHYKPVRVSNRKAIQRYGFIERHVTVPGNANSHGDLVRKAKHEIYKQMQKVRQISSLTVAGIATTRRGDTIRISLPSENLKGDNGILWVTSVEHTLTPSDYTMSLTLQVIDPLDPNRALKEAETAARRRKRLAKGKHS